MFYLMMFAFSLFANAQETIDESKLKYINRIYYKVNSEVPYTGKTLRNHYDSLQTVPQPIQR